MCEGTGRDRAEKVRSRRRPVKSEKNRAYWCFFPGRPPVIPGPSRLAPAGPDKDRAYSRSFPATPGIPECSDILSLHESSILAQFISSGSPVAHPHCSLSLLSPADENLTLFLL